MAFMYRQLRNGLHNAGEVEWPSLLVSLQNMNPAKRDELLDALVDTFPDQIMGQSWKDVSEETLQHIEDTFWKHASHKDSSIAYDDVEAFLADIEEGASTNANAAAGAPVMPEPVKKNVRRPPDASALRRP